MDKQVLDKKNVGCMRTKKKKKEKKKDVRSVCRVGQTFSSAVEQGLRDGERCQAIFTIYTKFSQTEEILSELIRKVTTNARKKKDS